MLAHIHTHTVVVEHVYACTALQQQCDNTTGTLHGTTTVRIVRLLVEQSFIWMCYAD
jgi:hypothetical protein